jgi:hyperosmotically inducible periplasmic protein
MKAAWNMTGVIALLALVAVASPASAQEKIKEGAEATKDAVVKGVTVAADKTKEGLSKAGEVMTDGWITTRVH